jgi:multidrug efflux system outer membrane protein
MQSAASPCSHFHRTAREIRTDRARREASLRQALLLANLRYERGLSTYLDVLDAQRQLFQAELDLASITQDQLTAVVQVYKALGGGWESAPAVQRAP